jgi:AmmeMemoRadiSam system protein B
MTTIRPPAVAGSFYPDDPAMLSAVVEDFLTEVSDTPGADPSGAGPPGAGPLGADWPKAVIAPHAGYIYSGPVAASAYARLRAAAGRVGRVVVIGPSHTAAFPGIAAPATEVFETPLGRVPVDGTAVTMIAGLPQITIADGPHIQEHAIEVQLPFLQTVLGDFAVVPLAVGEAGPAQVAEVLARLWGGPETVVVASSDLSHYHPHEVARRLDAATAAAIEAYEAERLGPRDACGYQAVAGLLVEAKARGLAIERLDLRNSGETRCFGREVVGYGAWAFHAAPRR